MPQTTMQKITKGVLVGVLGVLAIGLLSVFVSIFFGRGNTVGQDTGIVVSGIAPMMGGSMMGYGGDAITDQMMKNAPVMPMQRNLGLSETVVNPAGAIPEGGSIDQKIMKTGSLDVRVQNADSATDKIRSIAGEKGGLVANVSFWRTPDNVKTGSITIKVPVAKFEETFAAVKQVATLIVSENISGSDVTEQYIDLQARLKNKQAEESALQSILEKAQKTSDVIEVTRELANTRAEIESLNGQLRYLANQTDLASITVSMTEDPRIVGDQTFRPGQTLAEAVTALLKNLSSMAKGLLMFVIVGLPMVVIYGLILWGVYILVRKIILHFWK